jgi:hypothetical protein
VNVLIDTLFTTENVSTEIKSCIDSENGRPVDCAVRVEFGRPVRGGRKWRGGADGVSGTGGERVDEVLPPVGGTISGGYMGEGGRGEKKEKTHFGLT